MVYIWIDDLRSVPERYSGKKWNSFQSVNDAMKYIRKTYKSGQNEFFLDLDHDAGDYAVNGGDYINILTQLEDMYHNGHLRNINITCHFHSMNAVGVANMRAVVEANSKFMNEGRLI